jgi:hypothetical protein
VSTTSAFLARRTTTASFVTIPQNQWASKLIGFDFRVEFRPGTNNVVTGALSRRDTEEEWALLALLAPSFQIFDGIRHKLDSNLDTRSRWQRAPKVTSGAWRTAWSLSVGACSFHWPRRHSSRCSLVHMAPATRVPRRRCTDSARTSTRRARAALCASSCAPTLRDSATNQNTSTRPGCCNHLTCPPPYGLTSP